MFEQDTALADAAYERPVEAEFRQGHQQRQTVIRLRLNRPCEIIRTRRAGHAPVLFAEKPAALPFEQAIQGKGQALDHSLIWARSGLYEVNSGPEKNRQELLVYYTKYTNNLKFY